MCIRDSRNHRLQYYLGNEVIKRGDFMDTGRLINKLSNCLRRRSAKTQKRIHISGTKGQILNYILIESQKRPLVQRDIEQEFGLRPSTATDVYKRQSSVSASRARVARNLARPPARFS